ncbi:uncharacterized protein OCT59_029241 [Rhizophagus irregularis]|uniref:uncharacterized protein n=1 Tax=Rhizophagus irregularis TaxID=588596 RepID=UPI0033333559|nr:hypothetical protein OCT59_029241 [Rhizophagus irregularis]
MSHKRKELQHTIPYIQRYPYTTCYRNTRILDGVIPYMDPKFFEENHSYECWQNEPVERPYIDQVIQELDGFNPIDPIDPENKNVSTGLNSNESESTEIKILTWL